MLQIALKYTSTEDGELSLKISSQTDGTVFFSESIEADYEEPLYEVFDILLDEVSQVLEKIGSSVGTVLNNALMRVKLGEISAPLKIIDVQFASDSFQKPIENYLTACFNASRTMAEYTDAEFRNQLKKHAEKLFEIIAVSPEKRMADFKNEVLQALESSVIFSETAKAGLPLKLIELPVLLGLAAVATKNHSKRV